VGGGGITNPAAVLGGFSGEGGGVAKGTPGSKFILDGTGLGQEGNRGVRGGREGGNRRLKWGGSPGSHPST